MTLFKPSYTGDAATGLRQSLIGDILDLNIRNGQRTCSDISYHVHAANVLDKSLAVYVDGELNSLQPLSSGNGSVSVGGLADGSHSIKLIPHRTAACWKELHGDIQGGRIYVTWTPTNDATLAAYQLYWDNGTGIVTILLDTLDTMAVQTMTHQPIGDSCVISVWGVQEDIANDQINLSLTPTAYSFTCENAATTGSGSYARGDTITLAYGVSCQIEVPPTTSASTTIHVGPAWEFLTSVSTTLTAGTTYSFIVYPVDAAGNVGLLSPTKTVYFAYVPPALAGVSRTWTTATSTLAVSWTSPGSGHSVRVYTNYNADTGVLEDHINEDKAYAVVSHPTASWSFDATDKTGTLKYYLRHYYGTERKDCTLYSIDLPPTAYDIGIVLGTPYNVTVEAIADGKVSIQWDYKYKAGDSIDSFSIWIGEAPSTESCELFEIAAGTGGTGYPVLHTTYSDGLDHTDLDTCYVCVMSYDSASGTGYYSSWASCVPTKTAPATAVGLPGGVQQ